jgi:hypothetical protein
LKHFEECYEHQYYLKLSESEAEQEVSDTIRLWLDNMDKKLDYIYNYQIQEEYYSEEEDGEEYEFESEEKGEDDNEKKCFENCVFGPFNTSIDNIKEDSIEEIVSIASKKSLTKVQGKCSIRLKDGTELIGSWQNGRRNGQGSVSSPFLEHLGVQMLAGNYVEGLLCGIGRIQMSDESVREGWFFGGRADGPFRGVVKVVYFFVLLTLPLLVFFWVFNLLSQVLKRTGAVL